MTLKEHIDDIRKRLEKKEIESEAAVRQGIVERLLRVLAWPTHDTKIVFPEYGVEEGDVDYALCDPASTPRIFIEVKRVGNIDKGIEQLFKYAFHTGVLIVVLTDGQKWRFYYPAGEGSYENRKVAELDFVVGNSDESAKCLNRYVKYERVKSGGAAKVIAEDYQSIVNQRKIEERLPEAWSKLLQDEDKFSEFLIEAIAGKTESLCRARPTHDQMITFLKSLSVPSVKPKSVPKVVLNKQSQGKKEKSPPKRIRVTMSNGEVIEREDGNVTFSDVIAKLGIEQVRDLEIIRNSIPLISTYRDPEERRQHQRGKYYIVSGLSAKDLKGTLDRIAKKLEIDLDVELVDKV